MKRIFFIAICCIIVNKIIASDYTQIVTQIISKEQKTDIETIQVDVSIKFLDTLNWNFQEYFILPQNWYAETITNFDNITFLPNDSVIYSFNLTYNLDSLPQPVQANSFKFLTWKRITSSPGLTR